MTTNKKVLATSGTALALSIMLVAGLSFASAHNDGEGFRHGMFEAGNMDHKGPFRGDLSEIAEFLNISEEALRERLDSGETLHDVAESLGVTAENMREHHEEMWEERKDEMFENKAEFFGITPEELKERLDNGETWKEIAESLGITEEDIQAHVKENAIEHVEQLLADGEIDQERYDELIERIESGDFQKHKMHRKGHMRHFMKHHRDGGDTDED